MQRYLNDEHRELQAMVRAFGADAIAPVARGFDHTTDFPWENVKAMGELGLFGVAAPRDLGGLGRDFLSSILVVEELARWDASHAITVSAHAGLGTSPIINFGTESQKARWVPLLASGKVLGGFGLTEAGAGSDASGTRTRAVPVPGGHRIDGAKLFITHAGVGEVFIITAVTDPSAGAGGITSFVVTKPTCELERAQELGIGHAPELGYIEGVRAGKKEDKMGWRSSDTRELILEDAFVPVENQLGEEGAGFTNVMKTLDAGRIGIAALALGLAQGAFDVAFRYVRERERRGKKVWDSQMVKFRLADAITEIEAARHLTYHAAWLKDTGQPFAKQAAMAKLFSSELATRVALGCIGLMGADGYTDDYPVERMARDAKICEIGEGTNEIQRLVIGRHLLREIVAEDEDRDRDLRTPRQSEGNLPGAREPVYVD